MQQGGKDMPTTLTRSLLVVLIPGLIASAPWLLFLIQFAPDTLKLVEHWQPLAYAALFALIAVVGSLIEGLGTYLEHWWDNEREKIYDVREQWFKYLSHQLDPEPVGYRYVARMVTTMYFELGMLFASAIFALGSGFAVAHIYPERRCVILGVASLVSLACIWYFRLQARETHLVLCKTRKEINERTTCAQQPKG
jgi:hypothetical protein